jgi:hypothetical protein
MQAGVCAAVAGWPPPAARAGYIQLYDRVQGPVGAAQAQPSMPPTVHAWAHAFIAQQQQQQQPSLMQPRMHMCVPVRVHHATAPAGPGRLASGHHHAPRQLDYSVCKAELVYSCTHASCCLFYFSSLSPSRAEAERSFVQTKAIL